MCVIDTFIGLFGFTIFYLNSKLISIATRYIKKNGNSNKIVVFLDIIITFKHLSTFNITLSTNDHIYTFIPINVNAFEMKSEEKRREKECELKFKTEYYECNIVMYVCCTMMVSMCITCSAVVLRLWYSNFNLAMNSACRASHIEMNKWNRLGAIIDDNETKK